MSVSTAIVRRPGDGIRRHADRSVLLLGAHIGDPNIDSTISIARRAGHLEGNTPGVDGDREPEELAAVLLGGHQPHQITDRHRPGKPIGHRRRSLPDVPRERTTIASRPSGPSSSLLTACTQSPVPCGRSACPSGRSRARCCRGFCAVGFVDAAAVGVAGAVRSVSFERGGRLHQFSGERGGSVIWF